MDLQRKKVELDDFKAQNQQNKFLIKSASITNMLRLISQFQAYQPDDQRSPVQFLSNRLIYT